MLQSIREHTSGWIAGIIIGLLAIPFAMWGVGNYFTGQITTHVAVVNGQEISQGEFQERYNEYRQQVRARMGESFDAEAFESPEAKQRFLQDLVRERVLRQAAAEYGYTVSAQTLAQTIASYPAFQVNGEFNLERYQQVLAQTGISPIDFERRIRESLLAQALPQALRASSLATEQEVTDLLRLSGQTRGFDYLVIDSATFRGQVQVTDQEIATYYQQHPDEFMTPETVSIQYVEVSAGKLADGVSVDEAALRAYFNDNRSSYLTEEQRRASHILIQVPDDADQATEQAALQEAQSLVEQLRSGAEFAALARAESDDVGSARSGGELGWVERGQMSSSFEEALFSLEPGEVSDPVRTSFGYHIIKLEDVQASTGQTYEEARARVASDFKAAEAERLYLEQADRLVNLTYQTPSALQPAAEVLGLELQEAGPFTREGAESGIAANEDVVEAAFSDLVLGQGMNSDPIELGPNHIAVLRVSEHLRPELQPLGDVKAEIRDLLLQQQTQRLARQQAQSWVKQLQSGETSLAAVAEQLGQELVEADAVNRNAQGYPQGLLEQVFELPAPDNAVSYHALASGDGRFAVLALREIQAGEAEQAPDFQRQILRQQIQQSYLAVELQALLDNLVAQADVELAEDRL